jgi:ABC-type multidrug transport system ATPase subunit
VTAPLQAPPPSATVDGEALAVHGLRKSYGSRLALDGLDLSVPTGVVYGFLGPNGAGKTTLMRCLVGLIRPDAGSLNILGAPYTWRDRKRLYRVGALVESPVFYAYLSGRDNLRTLAATGGPVPKGRVDEVLGFVGLHERGRDKVGNYSLGMKQRLGIAAAMLSDPDLLLLDEPANGLDPGGIVAMRQTLRYLTANGKTVFISSHILPEVQQLADVIGIVDRGKLVREGRLEQLLNEGSLVRVRVSQDEVPRAMELLGQLQVTAERDSSEAAQVGWLTVRVAPDRAAEINRALAQGGVYASAIESGNDLETVFLQLTASAPPPPSQAGPAGPPPGWGERG